jgi:hypothetical protein
MQPVQKTRKNEDFSRFIVPAVILVWRKALFSRLFHSTAASEIIQEGKFERKAKKNLASYEVTIFAGEFSC